MTILQDGTGAGYEAAINSRNQLKVLGTVHFGEHESSLDGDAYFAHMATTADTLTVTTTGGPMIYMKNTSTTKNLIISKIIPSTDQAATVMKLVRDPTLGTIGNENTLAPPNINMGSNRSAEITCYNWDEVGNGLTGLTGGIVMATYVLGVGVTLLPIDDAIILTPGTDFHIELSATGSTSECTLNVRFHYEAT